MKKSIYISLLSVLFFSCSDDNDKRGGNPSLEVQTTFTNAMFGDSLSFEANVSDEIPLSTLKAILYVEDEAVSETVIRTKTYGEYQGKIYIPFRKETPNGVARLEFVLQNIEFGTSIKSYDLSLVRPEYPYLLFITDTKEYKMEYAGNYKYELTETFPQEIKGYIKTPTVTANGNEMTFGWEDNAVTQGSVNGIPFSNSSAGEYTISFNSFSYAIAPFIDVKVNGTSMESVADGLFKIDLTLTKGQKLLIEGISGFEQWWIDPDFFTQVDDKLECKAIDGKYRISADFNLKYLNVEVMRGDKLASLQADGTGAIWIIGDSQGKPSFLNTGWDPNKATCMVPMGNGIYQISFIAGKTIKANQVNFVMFQAKDWSPSFGPETLTVDSDLIIIGEGQDVNGVDKGNIALAKDKVLKVGKVYLFTVDVSAGIDKAVLTVQEK